jgi:hypothetical protein
MDYLLLSQLGSPTLHTIAQLEDIQSNISYMCNFGGFDGKESACNMGDLGLIPGLRRSPGEGKSYLLQYSGMENSMNCIVRSVTKSWID